MKSCLLMLFTLPFNGAGNDVVELKEIGVSLPAAVAGIKYQGRRTFDEKALGYSVAYGNKMCTITLIVYDFDKKNIPNGKDNPLVADQMRRSIEDLKTYATSGVYKNLQPIKGELPLPKPVLEAFSTAGYTFDTDGRRSKSFILLTARQQHFFKVRLTQYVVDQSTNDDEVRAFLNTLVKAVSAK